MIDSIKKFFGASKEENNKEDAGHDTRVAAFALMLEMASADDEFSENEQNDIMEILKKEHGLEGDDAKALLEESKKKLDGSADLWQFTKLINTNYSKEEKIKVIEMVWQVVYSDGVLDKHEDYLVHKLGKLLRLSHKELIESKLKVRDGKNSS